MNLTARPVGAMQRPNPRVHLWVDSRACLPHRFPHVQCEACASVCPVDAIRIGPEGPGVEDHCLHCGRCTGQCPTGALSVPGFDSATVETSAGEPVQIDCWRVNAHDSPPGAMRIPCLGGLRESRLLGLARHAGGAPVQLLDRGACGDCPANPGGRHPAADTVASVHQWLEWLDPSAPERIEITPSPAKHALAREIPGPEAHRPVSRRGFLRALQGELDHALNQAERATSTTAGEAAPVDGHARIHPRERMSFLVELVHAAKRAGTDFPSARLFPRIHVTSDCRNDNLCAALCPTAALKPYRDHADAGLQFDAAACIQCQACESACPHAALSLTWEPPDAQVPCWQEPTRHTTRICTQCDTHFVDSGHADDELPVCPACRRSQAFARAGFETLFRHATTRVG